MGSSNFEPDDSRKPTLFKISERYWKVCEAIREPKKELYIAIKYCGTESAWSGVQFGRALSMNRP